VSPPEILARPEGAAIAGWQQLTIELSDPGAGLRHVLVVLDETGWAISANDSVLYRTELPDGDGEDPRPAVRWEHESVGGRLERDGGFLGTRWLTITVTDPDSDDEEDVRRREATPSPPSDADVAAIKALVAEVRRRAGL